MSQKNDLTAYLSAIGVRLIPVLRLIPVNSTVFVRRRLETAAPWPSAIPTMSHDAKKYAGPLNLVPLESDTNGTFLTEHWG